MTHLPSILSGAAANKEDVENNVVVAAAMTVFTDRVDVYFIGYTWVCVWVGV